jgi:hypothetical protein
MLSKLKQTNYKNYPECMFAVLSSFLPAVQADVLRRVTGSDVFRSTDENGGTYKNGLLHSFDDKPAVSKGQYQEWYKDGKLHRDGDVPAVVCPNRQEWYKDGKRHRDGDLPAVVTSISLMWYKTGRRHRDGLPALVDSEKSEWWENGVFMFLEENEEDEEEELEQVEYDEDDQEFYDDDYAF